jgi:AraC-like DNA-binding protein/DNA-binding NarL/FixJ family response regulator
MGFELVAAFEDGRETIQYLESNPVDVVLTDIKMAEVSGTDVARFVHARRPGVRVVFLSAYREFDDAKVAIECGVQHYLLKPVRARELAQVFGAVRQELDREQEAASRASEEKRQHQRLIRLFQEHYFLDLVTGMYVDRNQAVAMLREIGLGVDPAATPCWVLHARIGSPGGSVRDGAGEWKVRLRTFVHELFTAYAGPLVPFPLTLDDRNLDVVCFLPGVKEEALWQRCVAELGSRLRSGMQKELGVRCTVSAPERYDTFLSLADHFARAGQPLAQRATPETASEPAAPGPRALRHYHEAMLAGICSGDVVGTAARVDELFASMQGLDIDAVRNLLVHLFATLSYRLENFGIEPERLSPAWHDYATLLRLQGVDEIRARCSRTLVACAEELGARRKTVKGLIMERAKEYIRENCCRSISLHDVSSHVYLSPIYFSHVFKKESGLTFMDFLTATRMEKAGELLRKEKRRVRDVSETVGYQSTRYFSRLFRRHFGVSPSEYCRNLPAGGMGR